MNQNINKENKTMDTKIFNFNGQDVRVLGTQDEPLFVAKDVALILGYSDQQGMTRGLDDDERGVAELATPSGVQKFVVVTESGLYSGIMRSTLPEAKAFKKWVTSEVLPSIRKHGAYATPSTAEAILNDPDVMIKVLTALKEERIAKVNAQLEAKEAQRALEAESAEKKQISEEKKVVEKKFEALGTAVRSLHVEKNGTVTVRDAAKFFASRGWNLSESTLRKTLQDAGWLTKGKGPTATASAVGSGYMAAGVIVTNHLTGWSGEVKTPKITGKGMNMIATHLPKWGYSQMDPMEGFKSALEDLING